MLYSCPLCVNSLQLVNLLIYLMFCAVNKGVAMLQALTNKIQVQFDRCLNELVQLQDLLSLLFFTSLWLAWWCCLMLPCASNLLPFSVANFSPYWDTLKLKVFLQCPH